MLETRNVFDDMLSFSFSFVYHNPLIVNMIFVRAFDCENCGINLQIVAYLLLSAASAAVPLTNSMRQGSDNIFTDSSASAISMEFFAFFSLALSALISGYKLSNQTYI